MSDIANDLLKRAWIEEEKDLKLIAERRKQPSLPYEEVVAELRRDGLL